MERIQLFIESWDLLGEAALSGALSGALLGALGVYILLGKIVFLSAALSQISCMSVALSFWLCALLGIEMHEAPMVFNPAIFSILVTMMVLALCQRGLKHTKSPDSMLAALYIAGSSGTILIGTQILHEIPDIQQLLTGNAVLVEHNDFILLCITTLITLFLFIYAHRGFESATFWPERSRVAHVPVTLYNLVKYVAITIVIALTTRMMGALPVFALSCLPALAVRRAPNLRIMFWLALLLGSAIGFSGYIIAFIQDLPVGPTQAALALFCVVLSSCFGLVQRIFKIFSHFTIHTIHKEFFQ